MKSFKQLIQFLQQTHVVRAPQYRLSTFGKSEIQYHLVSSAPSSPSKCILRIGQVSAERPKILTPESFSQRFLGFGEEGGEFENLLKEHFHDTFRSLEYNFRNRIESTISHQKSAQEISEKIKKDLEERNVARAAVILGPEKGWQSSIMKFILDETTQSFSVNMRELEERGLFDPTQIQANRERREIETLFRQAKENPVLLKDLAKKLREYHLFEEYQDRFFAMVKG